MPSSARSTPAAAPPRPGSHLVIRASAGSGKTYQLSTRYIARLADTTPDRILATTFTRKAAGEILERILRRLAEAALDAERRSQLAESLNLSELPSETCLQWLVAVTRNLHRVRVATLDSFFSRVAGSFALELGLPAGWTLLDESQDDHLRSRAVEAVLREGDRRDLVRLIHLLSKGQAQRRVTSLIRDCVDELYAVFRETGPEAWERIQCHPMLSGEQLDAAIAALAAVPLPSDKRWHTARQQNIDAIAANDWEGFIGKGLGAKVLCGETSFYKKPIEPDLVAAYRPLLSHACALECEVLSNQLAATYDLLSRFHIAYTRLKRDAGGLTFDDVTLQLAAELSGHDPAGLAFRLDAQLDHLLLDEFQDTSLHQWRVLEPLATSVVGGSHSSFFCVGDVKQAIYGWRGGVAEIFRTVTTRLSGLCEQSLDESFRSSGPVIDTVNQVFCPTNTFPMLDDAEPAALEWVRNCPPHSTRRTDLPGYACLRTTGDPEPNEKVDHAVLRHAAAHVAELLPQLPEPLSVGILVRTNDAVGRVIAALREHKIIASDEGGNPLDDAAAVQLVLSAMQLADHPGDTIARFHLAHSPLGPVLDIAPDSDDGQVEDVARDLRRRLLETGYGPVLEQWLHVLAPYCDSRELNRLRQLVALGDAYEPIATLRPSDFADYVRDQRVEDPRAARVRVMTVHKAKGLEFDVVVLPQLDTDLTRTPQFVTRQDDAGAAPTRVCRYRGQSIQKLLPEDLQTAFRQTAERQVREAMCVLYVALTRAVHALHILVAPNPKRSKTYAAIVRAALAPGRPTSADAVLYECGDPQWFRQLSLPHAPTTADPSPQPASPDAAALQLRLAPMPDGRQRGRPFLAPSHHAPLRCLTINDAIRSTDSRALERGSLLHAWFEHIQWLDDAFPAEEALMPIAGRLGFSGDWIADCLQEFRGLLKASLIGDLFHRQRYLRAAGSLFPPGLIDTACEVSVNCERRFDYPAADGILAGSIDRLVVFHRSGRPVAADILDFKSDSIWGDLDSASRLLADRYRDQLSAYREAVAAMYSLPRDRIAARLVVLAGPAVIDINAT